MAGAFKTFWDIERERTGRIYSLFAFLAFFYFLACYFVWLIIKLLFASPQILRGGRLPLIGWDTVYVLAAAVLIAVGHWYYSNRVVVGRILHLLAAQPPDKNDRYHQVFENVVDEIQSAAGGIEIERYILPTGAMNAFAISDLAGRRVIGVTEGLLSRLRRAELQAVVSHEVAHIASNDSLLTTVACSLFGIFEEALAQLPAVYRTGDPMATAEERGRRVAAALFSYLPVMFLLFAFDILNQIVNMFISREKEYRADAAAVRLTRDPISLASALYKIAIRWRGAGYGGDRISSIFILSPAYNILDESSGSLASLFSTHPPVIKRLQVLLDLGHGEISQLTEEINKKNRIRMESATPAPAIIYYAELNGEWYGPFTPAQAKTIDWLTPETRLRPEGSREVIAARAVPELGYFFKVRDAAAWKIKRLCPLCRQWLLVDDYEGLNLWRCAFCDGVMVEQDKIPRIIARREKAFNETVVRLAEIMMKKIRQKHPKLRLTLETAHPRPCPRCGKPMVHKLYSYAYHVEIDECRNCRIVWFDANELEILQYFTERAEEEK